MNCLCVFAYDCEIDGIYYNRLNATEFEVASAPESHCYKGNVTIPSEVNYKGKTFKIVKIARYAFHFSEITSISIPNSVEVIDEGAFSDCESLTTINFPDNLKSIGYDALKNCVSLTSITIPNSVTSIGGGLFEGCVSLTSAVIPSSVKTYNGNSLFNGCKSLTSYKLPYDLDYIGFYEFRKCESLKSITIPKIVNTIYDSAFEGCTSIKSITIPNSVNCILEKVFKGMTALTTIYMECVIPPSFSAYYGAKKIVATAPFDNEHYTWTDLYVPFGSKENYQNAKFWRNFKSIIEYDPSGIVDLKCDSPNPISRYNIQGQRLVESQKGINLIKLSDGTTRKILVK